VTDTVGTTFADRSTQRREGQDLSRDVVDSPTRGVERFCKGCHR
jgi:hypothetical protein